MWAPGDAFMTSCRDEYFFFIFFLTVSVLLKRFRSRPSLEEDNKKKIQTRRKKKQVKFSFYYKTSLSLIAFFSQGENASQLREPDFTDILSFSCFQNPD